MQNSDVFTGKSPKLVSFSEKPTINIPYCSSTQLTYRKLKRSNMIIEYLKSARFTTLSDLQKHISEKEKEEGYSFKVDKKSTARLVYNLCNAKKIKIFKAVLKLENEKAEIEFICDVSLTPSDPCIQVAIEQAKFKYFSVSKEKGKKVEQNEDQSIPVTEEKKSDANDEKGADAECKTYQQPTYKTIYHAHPKYLRCKTLHQFLYFLTYCYEGNSKSDDKEPIVYHNSMSWKRYVPPLPNYGKKGWCFMADVFVRMPLSVFIKVINLRHEIHDLKDYLENEEKKHYLLKHLPQSMRNSLLNNRKYLFSTDDVIKGLCYLGLVSLGPQVAKQKDQVFLYVHRNARIKDTTISTPGYIHVNSDMNYDVKMYTLNSLNDVESFWVDLEAICFHTPLGKYSAVAGKTIPIIEASHKPELMESLKHKNFGEISDVGHIPGDGLGAGGFDSALFLHSRRNWQSSNSIKLSEKLQNKPDKLDKNISSCSIQHLLQSKDVTKAENKNRLQRLSKNALLLQKGSRVRKENVKGVSVSSTSSLDFRRRRRTKYRTVILRKRKQRTPYYDEKDKAAIKKMDKARCDWSAQEDSFLLLCKVASSFLDPTSRTLVVPYTVVRDLLNEHLPDLSANKSSRACQRRLRYMMLNPATTSNVAVFLGEAKQDLNLVKEFEKSKPPKTQEEVWKNMFTTVLKKLLRKFTLPAADRCKNIALPNSLEQFNEHFEIVSPRNVFGKKNYHKDPENEEEAKYFTLYSLILSAMAIHEGGVGWSYLLHKLYQVYPENILKSVVFRLHNEKIIALKKRSNRKDVQRSLTTTFPYRFSVTYENTLLTKFPIKLFGESKELLDSLKTNSETSIELKGDIAPGYTAAIFSLSLLKELSLVTEVPEQIILFDTSLSKEVRSTIVQRMIHTLSDKESVELSRLLNNESDCIDENIVDEKCEVNSISNKEHDDEKESSRDNSFPENLEMSISQTNEAHRSSNASRFALYLLRQELSQPPIERVQHSQDYIVLNSCGVFCNLKSNEKLDVFPLNPPEIIQEISSSCKTNESRFITKEKLMLTDDDISNIIKSVTSYIPSEIFMRNQNYADILQTVYEMYESQTLQDAKQIIDYILKSNVAGVSAKELWQTFGGLLGELSVFEHLALLRRNFLVIRAGITTFMYVHMSCAESWILTSYMLSGSYKTKKNNKDMIEKGHTQRNSNNVDGMKCDEVTPSQDTGNNQCITCLNDNKSRQDVDDFDEDQSFTRRFSDSVSLAQIVHFIPRTWRHPDGTLNEQSFIELLSTVLSYIISTPGTTTARVCERFSLIQQPVQTLELIEILEKSHCVYKYYCKPIRKQTLFSTSVNIFVTENPDPEDVDHLEPLPDAICKLARIQESLQ